MIDLISRQAAIDACIKVKEYHAYDEIEEIKALPSAEAEPIKHGRWIKVIGENGVTDAVRCSICGFEDNRYELFNYCPRCGARMDEVEE